MTLARRRMVIGVLLGVGVAGVMGLVYRSELPTHAPLSCPRNARAVVLVDTSSHTLALCEGGRSVATFPVRLGRNGVGKAREGDRRTPLGSYALGDPRASVLYGTFVHVGYPTEEQRAAGLTGGAVGIHGPDRKLRWAGALVNLFDTTDGCVGIATDDEMARIAAWVRARRGTTIVLR